MRQAKGKIIRSNKICIVLFVLFCTLATFFVSGETYANGPGVKTRKGGAVGNSSSAGFDDCDSICFGRPSVWMKFEVRKSGVSTLGGLGLSFSEKLADKDDVNNIISECRTDKKNSDGYVFILVKPWSDGEWSPVTAYEAEVLPKQKHWNKEWRIVDHINGVSTKGLKHLEGQRKESSIRTKFNKTFSKKYDTRVKENKKKNSLVAFCVKPEKQQCTRDPSDTKYWYNYDKEKVSKQEYINDARCHEKCKITLWEGGKPKFVSYNTDVSGKTVITYYGQDSSGKKKGPVTKDEQKKECSGGNCSYVNGKFYNSTGKEGKDAFKNDWKCHEPCATTALVNGQIQHIPYNKGTSGTVIGYYGKNVKDGPVSKSLQNQQCGDTLPPPPTERRCGMGTTIMTHEKAETKSRLAVENMSMDGNGGPTPWYNRWTGKGNRSGMHTDSWWTDTSDTDIYTIAKPGDSIHFVHEVCMAVRYGQWTGASDQDVWKVGERSHSKTYDPLPTSWMSIGAFPNGSFAFGDGIDEMNDQTRSVTWHADRYTGLGQFSSGDGVYTDTTRHQLSAISPSENKTEWNCNGIFEFEDEDAFIVGGFQIPGFDTRSCSAGDSVGNNNLVGSANVFGQYHRLNSLKMWEKYSHTYGGSCGCGVNDAWFGGNHDANDFGAAWQGNGLGHRQNYQCRPKEGENNCDWHCTAGYTDEYGVYHCTDGYYAKYDYPYVTDDGRHSFKFMYHSMHRDYGTIEKRASVYVPYNFETSVDTSIDDGTLVQQGGSITSTFSWSIDPRANDITSSFDYATVTPSKTEVRPIEFIYDPNSNDVSGDDRSDQDPCSYFESKGAIRCATIDSHVHRGNQNEGGYYDGAEHEDKATRAVPDDEEYVGFRYCVALGIYPADSHNYEDNTIGNNSHNGVGMNAGNLWNISGASCRTIAKKPNYQVWNGSVYTQGEVFSYATSKMRDVPFHTDYNGGANSVFGSWVDYSIIAGSDVDGTASGAGFGFENSQYTLALPGGTSISNYNDALEKMTISNSGDLGHSNINASASINTNLQRLFSRYKDKAASLATSMNMTANNSQIITSDTGFQFVYAPGKTLNTSNISKEVSKSRENPNYNTVTANGDIYKSLSQGAGAKADNTLVIVADTVNINGDICTGAPCGSDSTRQYDYAHRNTNAAATIPQILIFANNINISENVTRVDAWLVADNGTVNTCSGQDLEAGDSGGVNPGYRNVRSYNTGTCAKTLMVNGPVYARGLKLNRTAGAHHGSGSLSSNDVLQRSVGDNGGADDKKKGSIAPAEIFNLRADVYLWAYNQAERSSEAVVTYVRELAPRY